MNRDMLASVIIMILGALLYYFSTSGFTAFTLEEQRLIDLKEQPPEFPDIEVVDHKGREYNFDHFEGKYIFMTFIYTSCTTACPEMTSNMKHVYDSMDIDKYEDDLIFLSMSFDTKRDTVEVLNRYAGYFNVNDDNWRMLRVPDENDLETILNMYGVTVIAEGDADYQHNTSFYLIEPDGTLKEVLDYREVDSTVDYLTEVVQSNAHEGSGDK